MPQRAPYIHILHFHAIGQRKMKIKAGKKRFEVFASRSVEYLRQSGIFFRKFLFKSLSENCFEFCYGKKAIDFLWHNFYNIDLKTSNYLFTTMKKLILIITGAFVSVVVYAQAPINQNPNTQTNPTQPNMQQNNPYQRTTDPTILNPAPNNHIQRVDTPAFRQRSDTTRSRDSINYNYRRNRTDSLPRDDRDPGKTPRMDRDTLRNK